MEKLQDVVVQETHSLVLILELSFVKKQVQIVLDEVEPD